MYLAQVLVLQKTFWQKNWNDVQRILFFFSLVGRLGGKIQFAKFLFCFITCVFYLWNILSNFSQNVSISYNINISFFLFFLSLHNYKKKNVFKIDSAEKKWTKRWCLLKRNCNNGFDQILFCLCEVLSSIKKTSVTSKIILDSLIINC